MSDSVTPWTVAHQVPLSIGLTRQEYWSRLPFAPPWDLLDSGIFCIGEDYLPQSHMGSWWLPNLFSSVQSLSRVWLFTPWTVALQASLSITNSWSLSKLMSIESVMPSNHLILCRPLLFPPSIFPSIRICSNESALHIGGQSIGVSASTSVLPMNIQDWFPLV